MTREQEKHRVPHGAITRSDKIIIYGLYVMLAVLLVFTAAYESGLIP